MSEPTRILYFGSREWIDVPEGMTAPMVRAMARAQNRLVDGPRKRCIDAQVRDDLARFGVVIGIEGEADGADITSRILLVRAGQHVERFAITREEWREHGKKAGPLRNERMLRDGRPHEARGLIVGARGTPHTAGSAHMLGLLRVANIPTIIHRDDGIER